MEERRAVTSGGAGRQCGEGPGDGNLERGRVRQSGEGPGGGILGRG